MTPEQDQAIKLGNRAKSALENYFSDYITRLQFDLFGQFITSQGNREELHEIWSQSNALAALETQIKIDIERGLTAQKEINT